MCPSESSPWSPHSAKHLGLASQSHRNATKDVDLRNSTPADGPMGWICGFFAWKKPWRNPGRLTFGRWYTFQLSIFGQLRCNTETYWKLWYMILETYSLEYNHGSITAIFRICPHSRHTSHPLPKTSCCWKFSKSWRVRVGNLQDLGHWPMPYVAMPLDLLKKT